MEFPGNTTPFDPAKDYYAILGVSPTAGATAIKEAYLAKLRRTQPVRTSDGMRVRQSHGLSKRSFAECNDAWNVLKWAAPRSRYEQARAKHLALLGRPHASKFGTPAGLSAREILLRESQQLSQDDDDDQSEDDDDDNARWPRRGRFGFLKLELTTFETYWKLDWSPTSFLTKIKDRLEEAVEEYQDKTVDHKTAIYWRSRFPASLEHAKVTGKARVEATKARYEKKALKRLLKEHTDKSNQHKKIRQQEIENERLEHRTVSARLRKQERRIYMAFKPKISEPKISDDVQLDIESE